MVGRPRTCRGVVDDYLVLDIADLCRSIQMVRNGSVSWHTHGGEELYSVSFWIEQTSGTESSVTFALPMDQEHNYRVHLTSTQQFFGGRRLWFRCPMRSDGSACGRRARLLYIDPELADIGCRSCLGLTYASCRSSHRYDGLFSFAERVGVAITEVKAVASGHHRPVNMST